MFSQPVASYIPPAIPNAEMGTITAGFHALLPGLDLVAMLYDRVDGLLMAPTFIAQRMRLPRLAAVEIKFEQNLAWLDSLYLIHPWVDFSTGMLLER